MEDCDRTDLPSTSSAVLTTDENYITDSSPEISEKKEGDDLVLERETDGVTANENENDIDVKSKKVSLKEKKETDSCPICLSSYDDRSFLDQCFHSFCFCCILQWCEVAQICPLCKAEFASVIHNVKSMQDYEQYIIEKKTKNEQATNNESYNERGFNEHGQRFRYRTTRTTRNNGENNNTGSETREHPEIAASRQSQSEGWGNVVTTRRRSRANIRGIEKRRQVYAFNLRATSSPLGRGIRRSRNISSQFFKTYQGCTHRLIPWLARDLRVLLGNNEEEVNFLMEFILSLITRIDMDSGKFVEELKPFLLQTTEHFVHELLSFAKAPFDMIAYDGNVSYPWPEESSQTTIPRDRDKMREEGEGHSSADGYLQQVTEGTPLSRCAWSNTPARLHHQVDNFVQDSPVPSDNVRTVEVIPVIDISDSTEGSETANDANRDLTQLSQIAVSESCADNSGRNLEEHQASITPSSLKSDVVRKDISTEGGVPTTVKQKKCVHWHSHKHVHKHKHKHRHKYKREHEYEYEHTHRRKRKHRDKRDRRHHETDSKSNSMQSNDDDGALSEGTPLSRCAWSDTPARSHHQVATHRRKHRDKRDRRHHKTDSKSNSMQSNDDDGALSHLSHSAEDRDVTRASALGSETEEYNTKEDHSPSVEEMQKEIEDLNVLIEQHEKLLSLPKRTETT